MLHRIGFMMAAIADTIGILGPVDKFGWWLDRNGHLPALEQGIHDGIMRDFGKL